MLSAAMRRAPHAFPRAFASFVIALLTAISCSDGAERELLRDPQFLNGFTLLKPEPGKREPLGLLQPPSAARPEWELAQWSSRFSAFPEPPARLSGGVLRWENPGKAVALGGGASARLDLALRVNGSAEYKGALRRQGEPWTHLLAEQSVKDAPRLSELRSLTLSIELRLRSDKRAELPGYTPDLHAAQFLLFLHAQNMNRASAGFGQYLHFGVPLYDDRHRMPPAHQARDTGGTGMFIYMPAASAFTDASVHDGAWVAVRRDVLPMIFDGLRKAWQEAHLTASQDPRDYRITFLTFGWELPGANDAEMEVRGLSLRADLRE